MPQRFATHKSATPEYFLPYHAVWCCASLYRLLSSQSMPIHTMPCCTMSCRAVILCQAMSVWRIVPSHTILCCAMLYCTVLLYHAAPWCAVQCCFVLHHTLLCRAVQRRTVLCYVWASIRTMLWLAMPLRSVLWRARRALRCCAALCGAPRRNGSFRASLHLTVLVSCLTARCHAVLHHAVRALSQAAMQRGAVPCFAVPSSNYCMFYFI